MLAMMIEKIREKKMLFNNSYGGYVDEIASYFTYLTKLRNEPNRKFVIFCFQRTGSTLLVSLLDSHPMIQCYDELLLDKRFFPKMYLDSVVRITEPDVFGFKLMPTHFVYQDIKNPAGFLSELVSVGFKIIKLRRRNLLRAAMSLEYAKEKNRYHYKTSEGIISLDEVFVTPQKLLERVEWIARQNELLDSIMMDLPALNIIYEDHLLYEEDQRSTLNQILDYLEIPQLQLETDLIRITKKDIFHNVSNADELVKFLQSTKYSKFLED